MSLWVVLQKELADTLRDRRTLWAMVLGPVLVMPLFVLLPQKLVERQMETQQAQAIGLAVAGGEAAPKLMTFLSMSGEVQLVPTGDPEALARSEGADVGLLIPARFEADLETGKPTELRLLDDENQMFSGLATERVRSLLAAYSQEVVGDRLEAQGVDPAILTPFMVEEVNLATAQQMSGAFLGMMLPMFIVLWTLVGGMYTTIDVTAGEKERLTLEPLLTSPASRRDIVLGKLLAVVHASLVAMMLAVGSMFVAFAVAPPTGEGLAEGLGTVLPVLLAALPVVVMFSGLQMAMCLMAPEFQGGAELHCADAVRRAAAGDRGDGDAQHLSAAALVRCADLQHFGGAARSNSGSGGAACLWSDGGIVAGLCRSRHRPGGLAIRPREGALPGVRPPDLVCHCGRRRIGSGRP